MSSTSALCTYCIQRKKSPSDSKYSGLRIRAAPSLKADMIGLIKPGDDVIYYEEVCKHFIC